MRLPALIAIAFVPLQATAEVPDVVTSIKPVYDLTRTIMAGVGEPVLLLSRSESVHHASLRPSRMRSLAGADLIIWIGENMEPWLDAGLQNTRAGAGKLILSDVPGLTLLDIRQPATLASAEEQAQALLEDANAEPQIEEDADFFVAEDDRLESELEADAAGVADAADTALLAEHVGDGDAALPQAGHSHEPGKGHDPHIWLDPGNAELLLDAIAATLSRIDPDNSEIYLGNAGVARQELQDAVLDSRDLLVNLTDTRFIFNHDSFQYFENAFGLKSIGALTTSAGQKVGARTISGLENKLEFVPVLCVVIDASESDRSAKALFGDAETIALDPLGFGLPKDESYPASLFLALAAGFAACE